MPLMLHSQDWVLHWPARSVGRRLGISYLSMALSYSFIFYSLVGKQKRFKTVLKCSLLIKIFKITTCLDALYMCLTRGRRWIISSPMPNNVFPNQEEKKTPVPRINSCRIHAEGCGRDNHASMLMRAFQPALPFTIDVTNPNPKTWKWKRL